MTTPVRSIACLYVILSLAALAGCGSTAEHSVAQWKGTMDTSATGRVDVVNPDAPIWTAATAWRVEEVLRIGSQDGDGPEVFGSLDGFTVDANGRVWALDTQAQDVRVFAADGSYLRTVGRRGAGPGEFSQAGRIDLAPDGRVWVTDRANARFSIVDTAGRYVDAKRIQGGFSNNFGGFDGRGRFYEPVLTGRRDEPLAILRHDSAFTMSDTMPFLKNPVKGEAFEVIGKGGRVQVGVPFQGLFVSQLSAIGTRWIMRTDQFQLAEVTFSGDTLRTATKTFATVPVTDAERADAIKALRWFVENGGTIDESRIPKIKPAVQALFLDENNNVWVAAASEKRGLSSTFHVFDAAGRYLGAVTTPFAIRFQTLPIFRDGMMYAVTRNELDVPFVVVAKIVRP